MNEQPKIVATRRLSLPVGHCFLLFLLFLGLKLSGCIEWNWMWVFLPLIAKIAYVATVFIGRITKNTEEDDEV